jgi:hypothetical protein
MSAVFKWALAIVAALVTAFVSAVLAGVISHLLGLPFDPENGFRFFSGFVAGLLVAKI